MKKVITILLTIVMILSFASIAHAQITKEDYYARSMLEGDELAFYDACYDALVAGDTKIYDTNGLSDERAMQIITYVRGDAPELFRRADIYTDEEAERLNVELQQKADEIVSLVNDDMSEYEKVHAIYLYLKNHITYKPTKNDEAQTIVGGLLNGEAVCGGISRSLQYILHQVDIPCYFVVGSQTGSTGAHSWNIIKINNEWYYADLTKDLNNGDNFLQYFLIDDNTLIKSHSFNTPEGNNNNPPLPACTSDKYMTIEAEPTPTAEPTPEIVLVAEAELPEPPGADYTPVYILGVIAAALLIVIIAVRKKIKQ